MSNENTNRHRSTKINVGGLSFEVLTLGANSQIDISRLGNGVIPKTLWIDLFFEFKARLGSKVDGFALVANDLRRLNSPDTIILFHEPISRSQVDPTQYTCQDLSTDELSELSDLNYRPDEENGLP